MATVNYFIRRRCSLSNVLIVSSITENTYFLRNISIRKRCSCQVCGCFRGAPCKNKTALTNKAAVQTYLSATDVKTCFKLNDLYFATGRLSQHFIDTIIVSSSFTKMTFQMSFQVSPIGFFRLDGRI